MDPAGTSFSQATRRRLHLILNMSTTTATPSFPSPASPTPTLEFVPPAVESLDFGKNCTLAGLWVVSSHVEFQATLDYIQQALPPDLNPPLTEYQTFEWFIYDSIYGNGTLYTSMYEYAVWNCTDEVCRDLDWEGNADLAGIGVGCPSRDIMNLTNPLVTTADGVHLLF